MIGSEIYRRMMGEDENIETLERQMMQKYRLREYFTK